MLALATFGLPLLFLVLVSAEGDGGVPVRADRPDPIVPDNYRTSFIPGVACGTVSEVRTVERLTEPEDADGLSCVVVRDKMSFSQFAASQPAWVYGAWSECSRECAGGVKTRRRRCLAQRGSGDELAPQECSKKSSSPSTEEYFACNTKPCIAEWTEWDSSLEDVCRLPDGDDGVYCMPWNAKIMEGSRTLAGRQCRMQGSGEILDASGCPGGVQQGVNKTIPCSVERHPVIYGNMQTIPGFSHCGNAKAGSLAGDKAISRIEMTVEGTGASSVIVGFRTKFGGGKFTKWRGSKLTSADDPNVARVAADTGGAAIVEVAGRTNDTVDGFVSSLTFVLETGDVLGPYGDPTVPPMFRATRLRPGCTLSFTAGRHLEGVLLYTMQFFWYCE